MPRLSALPTVAILVGASLLIWQWSTSASVLELSSSLPAPHRPAAPSPPPDKPALTLWHVTDSHLNLWHAAYGDVRDMCRSTTAIPSRRPGAFGHFNCDPSRELLVLALAQMKQVAPEPDLILLGGDVFGHVPAAHEDAAAVRESQRVQAELITAAFPRTTVLPVVGNHDTWPYFEWRWRCRGEGLAGLSLPRARARWYYSGSGG